MLRSLVGSEMCIRDSPQAFRFLPSIKEGLASIQRLCCGMQNFSFKAATSVFNLCVQKYFTGTLLQSYMFVVQCCALHSPQSLYRCAVLSFGSSKQSCSKLHCISFFWLQMLSVSSHQPVILISLCCESDPVIQCPYISFEDK